MNEIALNDSFKATKEDGRGEGCLHTQVSSRLELWQVCVCVFGVKRDLLYCQKRPTKVSKETYTSVKRDLLSVNRRG